MNEAENSQTFVLGVSGDHAGVYGHNFALAIVRITPSLARYFLDQMDQVRKDSAADPGRTRSVRLSDSLPRFFGSPDEDTPAYGIFEAAQDLYGEAITEDQVEWFTTGTASQFEFPSVVIDNDSLFWEGRPKYATRDLETTMIHREDLEEIVQRAEVTTGAAA